MKGYLKERSPGCWRLGVYVGRDDSGKKRWAWKSVRGSRRKAQGELNAMLAAAGERRLMPSSGLTVEGFLEKWLSDYAKHAVSAGTHRRYTHRINGMIVPAIGHRRLDQLKPMHVQAAYARWLESGRRPRPQKKPEKSVHNMDKKIRPPGLSPQTVLHAHRLLHVAFKTAVRWQLIPFNPIDAVTPPKVAPAERHVPDEASTMAFIGSLAGTRLQMPVLLAATAGLRRSEIVGLNWSDVDLAAGTLSVNRALERVGGADRVKPTKSKRSRRQIPLPKLTIAALKSLKASIADWKEFLGGSYFASERVCVHENGHPWTLDGLSSSYRKAAHKRRFAASFHGLRHAHATWLVKAGVHPRIVAERLGHSSTTLTMDTYSHVLPGMQKAAVVILDRSFKRAGIDTGLTRASKNGGKP